jgi:hypothetical protein
LKSPGFSEAKFIHPSDNCDKSVAIGASSTTENTLWSSGLMTMTKPIYALLAALLACCRKNLVRYIEYLTTQTFENQFLTLLAVYLKSYVWENKP